MAYTVCLSVLRHTPVFCRNGWTYHLTFFTTSIHTTLVFEVLKVMAIFRRGPPEPGRQMQWGMKKSRFSTTISLYLRNDTRYGHSYYGMRVENLTQAFEWYHFQSSSSRMRVMNHNWSATKQRLHRQSVAEISRHSDLSGDRIRQCGTSSGSRHKDTDQCL